MKHIKLFYTHILLILAVIASLTLMMSCDMTEALHEQPRGFSAPETFYSNPAQVQTAFVGAMGTLRGAWSGYGWPRRYDFVFVDQWVGAGLPIQVDTGTRVWADHYRSIAQVNFAIKSMKENGDKFEGVSQSLIDEMMGQGKFLRGMNYFFLVRYFGDIPLMTDQEPLNYHGDKPERSSIEDVYDLIISDLTEASEKLPSSWGEDKPARPTSGAARGLLAEVYLTMATAPMNDESYYQNARDEAQAVMDSGVYHLVEDVHDVFSYATEFGPEMMFSHVQNAERSGTPLTSEVRPGFVDRGWFEKYPDQPRRDAYFLYEQVTTGEPIDLSQTTPGIAKYAYMDEEDLRANRNYSNWPIVRYANVLLIFAEADNRVNGGPTPAAVEALNKIIDRANGYEENPEHPGVDTGMTMEEFEERVILERDLELSHEYTRWFDIIRLRLYPEAITLEEDRPNWQDYMNLLAIPHQDLRTNENLTQNPGYSYPSGVDN